MELELSASDALKLFEEQGREEANPTPKDEPAAPAVKADEPGKAEPEPTQAAKEEEPEPEGVATKDGKHVIPYSVLQSERNRAAQAEREVAETRARIATLEAALLVPKPTAKTGEPADTTELDTEDADRLAMLEEDFPTVAKELKAMRELVKTLEAKVHPLEKSTEQAARERANNDAMTVQEAIDSLPKMAHIQAANPEAFELAKEFDATLRDKPEWADQPIAERFAKVLQLVETTLGEIEIPGTKKPPSALDNAALKQAAAAKVATAAKAIPTSLSQFPAGEPVAADEAAAAEQMSTAQLASKMGRMTPAQMDAYLASL
ncbi:MAG: hypothetical protein WKF61_01125 [Luteimonas sp.]